jgi:RNA polymerase sigma-70 factor (ECF subfamily)
MELENILSPCLAGEESGESVLEQEVTILFDSLRPPLLRYLSSFGLAAHDCEEVVQEVFLSLFLHLRDGKPRSNIRGWVFRVAHNLGLKRRETNHRALKMVVCSDGPFMESQLDAQPDPEAHVFFLQRKQRLMAVVEALPENDRRCLYLRAEGLRYREIAGVVGMSLGGVAFSLARSLARLSRADGGVHV